MNSDEMTSAASADEQLRPFDKVRSLETAIDPIRDGSTIMFGGFGGAGFPFALRAELEGRRLQDLTVIGNNGDFGGLAYAGGLRRLICSFPTGETAPVVLEAIEAGRVELTMVPQGTLVERIRAGGAGLGGVLTPTGVGAEFAGGHQEIELDGRTYVVAPALKADVALLRAWRADPLGNLVHRKASRNFNPLMAMAADYTVAEVEELVGIGDLDPDRIHVPSPFVDAVVVVGDRP